MATASLTHVSAQRDRTRNNTRAAGVFYLVTFAASIPAAYYFLAPVLNDTGYIVGAGSDTRVAIGCLLDAVNALACIGTAVAVYPAVRHHNESLALGFVTSRMLEAAVIMIGVISLLAIVTLRHDLSGDPQADRASLLTTGHALLAIRNWTFLFGPNMCAALNALLFGTLLYRSRLVPRAIPAMGLLGAPLLLTATVAAAVGAVDQGSAWFIGALPVAAWELSIGLYMTKNGLRTAPDRT